MLIINVKLLICISGGKTVGQGHYKEKRSEKIEKVEEKQNKYSPKPLVLSPSGRSTSLMFHLDNLNAQIIASNTRCR